MPEAVAMTESGATEEGGYPRVSTGSPQADEILGGGFPANSITILMGHPGTGKTIFAEQLLFHNAEDNRPALYLTTLSEPLSKVVTYLQGYAFYDETKLERAIIYDDIGRSLAEQGIQSLVDRVRDAIMTISPRIIVIDSFKVVHDLSTSIAETRRVVAELAGLLSAYDVTTFLVGEYTDDQTSNSPEFAVADGIVQFSRMPNSRRDERHLRVLKLRGSSYREGWHAFHIDSAGLSVFPRLVTPAIPPTYTPVLERVSSGVDGLDALIGGGLWRGSNTLVVGGSGTGKTTLGICFAAEGVRTGEPSLYLNFQENPIQLARTIRGLGFDLAELERQGLVLRYSSPVELQIDSIIVGLLETVKASGIKRVVVDALGDLALAANDIDRFHDYVYSLVQHFSASGVTSLMTLEQSDRSNVYRRARDAIRLSSIADAIIELGTDLKSGEPLRTIRVAKLRGSPHELRPQELIIDEDGLHVRPAQSR